MEQVLIEFITYLVIKFPVLASILFVIGALRVVIKPLMSAFKAYVDYTPSTKDDVVYDKVVNSKWYKGLVFVIDWLTSIKL